MPLMRCQIKGKPGWKWGQQGKCYPYTLGDVKSEAAAKSKAKEQAAAIIINRSKRGTTGQS
jgi:hypothetical protein